jgi:hypothetical protein
MERGGAGGAWREQVRTHQGPIRGATGFPTIKFREGPSPRWGQTACPLAMGCWMHAARAKSGPSAALSLDGRVRERGGGVPILHGSRIGPIRVGHCTRGLGTETPLECVGDPRAGRVSEGRIDGTRCPAECTDQTALVVTAMARNGKPGDLGPTNPPLSG